MLGYRLSRSNAQTNKKLRNAQLASPRTKTDFNPVPASFRLKTYKHGSPVGEAKGRTRKGRLIVDREEVKAPKGTKSRCDEGVDREWHGYPTELNEEVSTTSSVILKRHEF